MVRAFLTSVWCLFFDASVYILMGLCLFRSGARAKGGLGG